MLENICQYFPAMIIVATLLGAVSGWFFKKITTYLNTKDLQEELSNKETELEEALGKVLHLEIEQNQLRTDAADLMEELDASKMATNTYQSQIDNNELTIEEKEQTISLLNDKIQYYELEWAKREDLSKVNADLRGGIDTLNEKIEELKAEILKKDALIVQKSNRLEVEQINQRKFVLENEEIVFEKDALKAKNTALLIELEDLKKHQTTDVELAALNQEFSIKIESLTNELSEAKKSNVLLNQENTVVDITQIMNLRREIEQLKVELSQKNAIILATGTLPVEVRDYRSRIVELENNEQKLSKELSSLRSDFKEIATWIKKKKNKSSKNSNSNNGVKITAQDVLLEEIRLNAHKIPFNRIGLRLDNEKDDLTKIKNITSKIEKRLNAAGINSYVQLVRMQDAEMIIIAEVIQIEVHLIISGNWKGQARILLIELTNGNPKDDLEKIFGKRPFDEVTEKVTEKKEDISVAKNNTEK